MNKIRKGEVKIYKGKEYIAIPDLTILIHYHRNVHIS